MPTVYNDNTAGYEGGTSDAFVCSLFCGGKREAENGVTFQIIRNTDIRSFHYNLLEQVAGSILDGVIASFHWLRPSGRTVDLGSTQSGG